MDNPVTWFEVNGPEAEQTTTFYSELGQAHANLYARVDDLQRYLDRSGSLGGTTVMPPMDMGDVSFATVSDPQGSRFGLYKQIER